MKIVWRLIELLRKPSFRVVLIRHLHVKRLKLAHKIFNHRFVRYSLVGVFSVLVYYVTLVFLVEVIKLSPTLASAFAFGLIVVIAYVLNYYWTFQSQSRHTYVIPRFILT